MELSKRLKAIADQVIPESRIADIGTDHAYIPIYLGLNHIISKGIAMDINKGPLDRADENIRHYQIESLIETRLSNGLEELVPGEVDIIIMAGMGGMLIIDILKRNLAILGSIRRLILQPQLDQKEVRKYIHQIDFRIIDEAIIEEEGKFYTIITAEPGYECYTHEVYYAFGKKNIDNKSIVLKKYLEKQLIQYESIIQNLQHQYTNSAKERLREVREEERSYKEVLDWL